MAAGTTRSVAQGSPLALEGDLGNRVWLIRDGLVKVAVVHRDGIEMVVALRGSGELVGELSVLDDEPRSATATALVPTVVQAIAAEAFLAFLRSDSEAALTLTKTIAGRLRESDAMRLGQAAEDVSQRLARCLIDLATEHGHPTETGSMIIDLPLTQVDLAGIVGASRDAVAKALQAWRDRDVVRTSRRQIELLNVDLLVSRHRLG